MTETARKNTPLRKMHPSWEPSEPSCPHDPQELVPRESRKVVCGVNCLDLFQSNDNDTAALLLCHSYALICRSPILRISCNAICGNQYPCRDK